MPVRLARLGELHEHVVKHAFGEEPVHHDVGVRARGGVQLALALGQRRELGPIELKRVTDAAGRGAYGGSSNGACEHIRTDRRRGAVTARAPALRAGPCAAESSHRATATSWRRTGNPASPSPAVAP